MAASVGMKVIIWNKDQAKKEISQKWRYCTDSRRATEDRWQRNEAAIYSHTGLGGIASSGSNNMEQTVDIGLPSVDSSDADMNVSYAFKNLRFIHAQMSANPPSVVMRPNSSDPDDRRKADAADRVVRYSIRHYTMQELVDQASLQALVYGTGVSKMIWDPNKGDILEFDEESGKVILDGDIYLTVPHIWNIFIDPDAQSIDGIKYIIERIYMDYDEACSRWPDKKEELDKSRCQKGGPWSATPGGGDESLLQQQRYNMVELLEYWETGLPTNGYLGRHAVTNTMGDEIEECKPSPHRFTKAGAQSKLMKDKLDPEKYKEQIKKLPQIACLPYHILTDVDVPSRIWGKSFLDYISHLQNDLNKLDTSFLDNVQANGVARLLIPEQTEIKQMGNSAWDVTKYSGTQPPHFAEVPGLMPEMSQLRQNLVTGINDVSGVNESMFGNQSREQSGASMQYATNQGNMIRRRLFNKYVLFVENMYKTLLKLVSKNWDIERTIHVIGKEKALEAVDIKGMDIDGGYDVVAEYGVSLSLDPMTRREEIITLQPLFKEAGISPRTQLKLMKLNELEGMYDQLQLAEDRQREIFEEMIATGKYIAPEMFMDHENMIAYALQYFMTVEFKYLETNLQELCHQHFVDRAKLPAKEKEIMSGSPPPAGGEAPSPGPAPTGAIAGPLPTPAGATGEQATAMEAPPMAPG